MPRPPSRRSFLQATTGIAISLAGCLNTADVPDLQFFNNMNRDATVTTIIKQDDSKETVFSDTTTIEQNETHRYRNPIRKEATFQIQVSVEDGAKESYNWDAPAMESYGLTVHLSQDSIRFGKIVS